MTLQFPHETIPVPDHGRYQLHNEIEDCIVCDKCAKICPVNCIDIVPIRSPEVFGETSDGTSRRIYAETFDIDMSKCMFCGLCTVVCPTESLTMTSAFDYSTFDLRDHLFPFGNMTDAQIKEKKEDWETHQTKPKTRTPTSSGEIKKPKLVVGGKPVFKPRVGLNRGKKEVTLQKPVFRPKIKPLKPKKDD